MSTVGDGEDREDERAVEDASDARRSPSGEEERTDQVPVPPSSTPSGGSRSALTGPFKAYESREISRMLDMIRQLNQTSFLSADIRRLLDSTSRIVPNIDFAALSGASEMAKMVTGSSLAGTPFESVLASVAVAQLFDRPAWSQPASIAMQGILANYRPLILDTAAQINAVLPKLTKLAVLPELQRSVVLSGEAWAIATRVAPDTPDAASTWRLLAAGRTTLGMSTTGLLLTETEDEEWEGEDLLDTRDDELVRGPDDARMRLRDALERLDPRLPKRLDGAWERVSHHGPDAASQAAHSMVELIDWTLRLAAPDGEVLAWHSAESRPGDELHKGQPTRALRIRFIVRTRPDAAAAEMYVNGMRHLLKLLQDHKHGAAEQQLAALARLVPTVEAHLSFLLL